MSTKLKKEQRVIQSIFPEPPARHRYNQMRKVYPNLLRPANQLVKDYGEGNWNQTLSVLYEDETLKTRNQTWTRAMILAVTKPLMPTEAEALSVTAYDKWHRNTPQTPSVRTIERQFGSYGALMEAMGYPYQAFQRTDTDSYETVSQQLAAYFKEAKQLRLIDYRQAQKANPTLPTLKIITRHYGTWSDAILAHGRQPNPSGTRRYSETDCLKALRQVYRRAGHPLTSVRYQAVRPEMANVLPSREVILSYFTSWDAALLAAEVPLDRTRVPVSKLNTIAQHASISSLHDLLDWSLVEISA